MGGIHTQEAVFIFVFEAILQKFDVAQTVSVIALIHGGSHAVVDLVFELTHPGGLGSVGRHERRFEVVGVVVYDVLFLVSLAIESHQTGIVPLLGAGGGIIFAGTENFVAIAVHSIVSTGVEDVVYAV